MKMQAIKYFLIFLLFLIICTGLGEFIVLYILERLGL